MKYSFFRKNMLSRYCRSCINDKLNLNLEPKDCIYTMYQNKCQQCGKMKYIVENIKIRKRLKLVILSDNRESR